MPELTRDQLAALIDTEMDDEEVARRAADRILERHAVVPLDTVQHTSVVRGHDQFDPGYWNGGASHNRGLVRSTQGYWNVAHHEDPTPAVAALILATRAAHAARTTPGTVPGGLLPDREENPL